MMKRVNYNGAMKIMGWVDYIDDDEEACETILENVFTHIHSIPLLECGTL